MPYPASAAGPSTAISTSPRTAAGQHLHSLDPIIACPPHHSSHFQDDAAAATTAAPGNATATTVLQAPAFTHHHPSQNLRYHSLETPQSPAQPPAGNAAGIVLPATPALALPRMSLSHLWVSLAGWLCRVFQTALLQAAHKSLLLMLC